MRVAIIGAGIVGASIARELSRYEVEVHLVEREADVGWGVSKANTGLIHAGYDDDPERFPNRARLCVEGNRIWHRWVEELDIPHAWSGALVIAKEESEVKVLEGLLRRGERNRVPELRILERDEALSMEPNLVKVEAALYAPTVGQISPPQAVIALVENAVDNGVKVHLDTEVRGVEVSGEKVRGLRTSAGFLEADIVINAAGLYADEISREVGADYFEIRPRKGEYLIFDEDAGPKPSRVLFPTPSERSKGVVVTTEVQGHLMVGPNAQDLPKEEKDDRSTTPKGLREIYKKASEIWPLPPLNKVIRTFSGLRPEPTGGDFVIRAEDVWGFVNVAGMRSPGLTAAPAVAKEVARILAGMGIDLREKTKWKVRRRGIHGNRAGQGRVICRCNLVREPEIREAIRRMKRIGVKTPSVDSVKFRTSATTGTCQGSFCRIEIASILAEEFNFPLWDVTLKGRGSELGVGDVKVLLRR